VGKGVKASVKNHETRKNILCKRDGASQQTFQEERKVKGKDAQGRVNKDRVKTWPH